jgi:hypothetical protein
MNEKKSLPILAHKTYAASSAFRPENLLREARRQKGLSAIAVPEICILDPDGDMVRHLRSVGIAHRHAGGPAITPSSSHFVMRDASTASSAVRSAQRSLF